ncbi:MAG: glycosyltransferase family 2 protein, partial [Gammaproteobacteria bacterium]
MSEFSLSATERNRKAIAGYLSRRQLYPPQSAVEPTAGLGLSVVIPCYNEPDICGTLQSLAECVPPRVGVEVIVVRNYPVGADVSVVDAHARCLDEMNTWLDRSANRFFELIDLDYESLPQRSAGVGLARKLGMDEALTRQLAAGNANGLIVSLDADCRVAKNYLTTIEQHFADNPLQVGASLYFEHPLDQVRDADLLRAISEYELHLRYYIAGQRYAGFPYATHTVGSALSVRAAAYARQGGMNRRSGGEDFYFVQKLIALGPYGQIVDTCVFPEVRLSSRVPFGTGPALDRRMGNEEELQSYPLEVFEDLKI